MSVKVCAVFEMDNISCVIAGLRVRRRPFTYNYHNQVSENARGLYAFWARGMCLYVGMSENIGTRMYQHRMNEHNRELDRYFSAFAREIEVAYIQMQGKTRKQLQQLEHKAICNLRPIANISHSIT